MLNLGRWQSLGKGIRHHDLGGAIHEPDHTLINDPTNEMIAYVYMIGMRVVLVVMSEGNCRLVVTE